MDSEVINPEEPELSEDYHDRLKRHHRYRDPLAARMWLVGIFVFFRLLDVAMVMVTAPAKRSQMVAALVLGALWTTTLLVGVWMRKRWARYILISLLFVTLLPVLFVILEQLSLGQPLTPASFLQILANVTAAVLLMCLKSIQDLTNKTYLA